jgi:hypothetical protein
MMRRMLARLSSYLRLSAPGAAAILALSIGAASASASSPAAFRHQLNAYCRSLTPRFKTLEGQISAAQSAKKEALFYTRAADFMTLSLQEDTHIESTVPPASMRAKVTAALAPLKKDDVVIRAALALHRKKKETAFVNELNKLVPLGGPANKGLDSIGLRDCGSDQG